MTILWQMTSISEATEQKGISGVKLGTLTHQPRGIPLGVGGVCLDLAGASSLHFAAPGRISRRRNLVLKYHLLYYIHSLKDNVSPEAEGMRLASGPRNSQL